MADLPNIKLEKLENIIKNTAVCSDFYTGAVKVLNETYLPKWNRETTGGYEERVKMTSFANMFAPVVDGITGLVTKKEPILEGYEAIDTKNIDLKQSDLQSFMKQTIKTSIAVGVCFVSAETNKELNRAYLKKHDYKNLYSYKIENNVLTQIVFKETIETLVGSFGLEEQERFIVFKVGGGEVWYADNNAKDKGLKLQDEWTNSLKEIPVTAIVTGKVLTDFEVVPKLLDIAILNNVHLNLESNLANVLGVIGNPVPMFFGIVSEADKDINGNVVIGVSDALMFSDKTTQGAEYLEAKGYGVSKLQEKIKEVEGQIDKLTFSMLLNSDSKTVIDAQQKQSKSTSFLSDIANETEVKFNKLLAFMLELENKIIPTDAKLELQKEYDEQMLDLEVALKMLQAGDMSRETFYNILKTGAIPKDFNIDEERERIERDA